MGSPQAGPLPETIGTESPFNYNSLHLKINDLLKFSANVQQKLHIRKFLSTKNETNRILFYTEGSIMHLGACT